MYRLSCLSSIMLTERYHLAYKIVKTESKLIRSLLGAHGMLEVTTYVQKVWPLWALIDSASRSSQVVWQGHSLFEDAY